MGGVWADYSIVGGGYCGISECLGVHVPRGEQTQGRADRAPIGGGAQADRSNRSDCVTRRDPREEGAGMKRALRVLTRPLLGASTEELEDRVELVEAVVKALEARVEDLEELRRLETEGPGERES